MRGPRPDLIGKYVSRFACSSTSRIATLNHETLDNSMKTRAIVGGTLHPLEGLWIFERSEAPRQTNEVGDCVRRLVIIQFATKLALIRFNFRPKMTFPLQTFGRVRQGKFTVQRIARVGNGRLRDRLLYGVGA